MTSKKQGAALVRYTFTWNNYQAEDIEALKAFFGQHCRYLIYGKEIGEECGTPHLQGYFELKIRKRITWLKKELGNTPHFNSAKGTAEQNKLYCSKGAQPKEEWEKFKQAGPNYGIGAIVEEFGKSVKQGQRTDIDDIKEAVKNGASRRELFDMAESYQAWQIAEVGRKLYPSVRKTRPTVWWFWGPTGRGKSTIAEHYFRKRSKAEGKRYWVSDADLTWWQDYDDQELVILDEFRGSGCKFTNLLRYIGKKQARVPIKNGHATLMAEHIIITSAVKPESAYSQSTTGGERIDQLLRRIDKIVCFHDEEEIAQIREICGLKPKPVEKIRDKGKDKTSHGIPRKSRASKIIRAGQTRSTNVEYQDSTKKVRDEDYTSHNDSTVVRMSEGNTGGAL